RAVREGNDLVARKDHREHAIEAREARAGHTERVDVLGAPELAQHLLGFNHAADDVLLHVVGHARLGEALENAGIRVARSRTSSQSLRNFKGGVYRHNDLCIALRSMLDVRLSEVRQLPSAALPRERKNTTGLRLVKSERPIHYSMR